jgi:hypothetical protein
MATKNCGNCKYIHLIEGQSYHDCRENSPTVIVPSFKPGDGPHAKTQVGKIMTVWPRVSETEKGCGRFSEKEAQVQSTGPR